VDVDRPATIVTAPPTSYPVPTLKVIAPPDPTLAAPLNNETDPDEPELVVPD